MDQVKRYTPESPLRNPRRFVAEILDSLRVGRGLAWRLFVRDLRSRYRQSFLGYVWLIIPPIVVSLTWIILNQGNIIDPGELDVPYPAFVLAGSALWQGFTEAINSPIRQLKSASMMLTKVSFPTEALLLAGALDVLFNSAVRLVVLAPLFVIYDVSISFSLLLAPIGLVAILAFGWGIGLLVAPFGLLYDDVERTILVVLAFLFLVSPVAYSTPPSGLLGTLQRFSPLTYLIDTARDWLLGGQLWPGAGWIIVSGVAVVLTLLGAIFYRLALPHLVDRMQS